MNGKLFIDGKWIKEGSTFPSICPETEEIIGYAVQASTQNVLDAVSSAKIAFATWSKKPLEVRVKIIEKASDILVERYGEEGKESPLKKLIHLEMGKRIPETDIEVIESSDMLRFFTLEGKSLLTVDKPTLDSNLFPTKESFVYHNPIGVIGIIKPWNYPLEIPIWSIGAALIAGNTVVFKPSEITPFIGIEIVKIFEEAGLPSGVLNLLTGDGSVGQKIVENEDVKMISFTGSQSIGSKISELCTKRNIKYSLELGGKDSMIILEDFDLEYTINGAIWGSFTNSGQVCVSVENIYVPQKISKNFTQKLVAETMKLRAGIDYGPLASEKQFAKVKNLLDDAINKGARVLCGGDISNLNTKKGFFFPPTIIIDTNEQMLIEQEEIFGPIAIIKPYADIDAAISEINNSSFDLGASVWSNNIQDALHIASRIDTGMVWVNDVNVAFPQCPWGAVRKSGTGFELSKYAVLEYTYLKHINIEKSKMDKQIWWYPY